MQECLVVWATGVACSHEPILSLDLFWVIEVFSWQVREMWYRAGADLVVVVHLLFICFVVGGAFLTWRWPRTVWAHVPAVIYGALVEFAGLTCPLTLLENDLRQRAGDAGYAGGFIDHYLIKVIYPPGLTRGMQIGLGVLVLLVAIIGYGGFLRRQGWISARRATWPVGLGRRARNVRPVPMTGEQTPLTVPESSRDHEDEVKAGSPGNV
jgi:hypothetical protein